MSSEKRRWMQAVVACLMIALLGVLAACAPGTGADPTATPPAATPGGAAPEQVLTWTRDGGIAGFCDELVITADGNFRASSCNTETVTEDTLTAEEMAQLETWRQDLASFDYEQTDEAEADAMIVRVVFVGLGSETATETEQEAIAAFASEIYTNATMGESTSEELPPEAVLAAQAWLAEELDVPVEQVEILDYERVQWPDSCLGAPEPDEMCAQVLTPGWRVQASVAGEGYELHTNETGEQVRLAKSMEGGGGELAGTRWTLVAFGAPGNETPALEGTPVTLEFGPDGQAGGSSGCNSYGGSYEVDGDALTFSEIVQTLRACEDEDVMTQEEMYVAALQTANSFELQGDRLTITYGDGEGVLIFEAGEPEGEDGAVLAGTAWTLVSFGAPGNETPVLEGTPVTLAFEAEGIAGGSSGCNSYGAGYQVDGDTLTFGEIEQTLIACEDEDVMDQEAAYLDALRMAESFELQDDRLTITYDEGVLVFEADEPAGDDGDVLAGTAWTLVSFGEAGSETPALEGTPVTLEFDANGEAGGSSGCNSYGGSYEVDGDTLTFGEIVQTLIACADEDVMDQEAAYLDALRNVGRFELQDDGLILYDDSGNTLIFEAA